MMLVILGMILIGIAIAVGIVMFGATSVQSNKDAIVEDLQNLSVDAMAFRSRPASMGGGSPNFTGYTIPRKLVANENATYTTTVAAQSITFVALSGQGYGSITTVLDSVGRLANYTYSGQF
jgi:hypothetical protein